jgi:hypothetical protein
MPLKIQINALTQLQKMMMIIWSETVNNMTLWHFKILLSTWKCLQYYYPVCTTIKCTVHPAKYRNLNVPSIPLHVSSRQLCWSFHFLNTTLPQWLLSSFGAKRLSIMKNQVLCFIPQKYSANNLDFLMITVTVFWLIWQCALPGDTIRIWSAAI